MLGYIPPVLPEIMVAPNGARKQKSDHPALPVTIAQTVETAKACFDAGARAMHFHVRDDRGQHVLDAGLYKEALAELNLQLPEMHMQITTEAVGIYSPFEMRQLVRDVQPAGVSIGLFEMIPEGKISDADVHFYQEISSNGTKIQHIIYHPEQLDCLDKLLNMAGLPREDFWCLFTIGHYSGRRSDPAQIALFQEQLNRLGLRPDWACCAFDGEEYATLSQAISTGGKVRVGFENSLVLPDGQIAPDNQAKVVMAVQLFEHYQRAINTKEIK